MHKHFKLMSGGEVQIDDRYGLALRTAYDGDDARVPINPDEARAIARALNAFAEIFEGSGV